NQLEPDNRGRVKFSFSRRPNGNVTEKPVPEKKKKKKNERKGEKAKGFAKTYFHTNKIREREEIFEKVANKSARSELLCNYIKETFDKATQQKIFDLRLDKFMPNRIDYTRNGRHFLIVGAKGHVAAFDWQTKRLHCKENVMEIVSDVKWLHQETMFAVAQKKRVYLYDNQEVEIHYLKHLDMALRLEFLPYHFLLCSSSAKGYFSYLDVSISKEVAGIYTKKGRLDVMAVNPQSAIVHLGHPNEPTAKVLYHASALRDVAVDASATYMATTGIDRRLKIFNLRIFQNFVVQLYKDTTTQTHTLDKPYIYHRADRLVSNLMLSPFEDVLGIGHRWEFSSTVVPVHMLLDKVRPEMITIDGQIGQVDVKTAMRPQRNVPRRHCPAKEGSAGAVLGSCSERDCKGKQVEGKLNTRNKSRKDLGPSALDRLKKNRV
ncbi:unnamed protein product, partial [Candidula unifasciata]